MMQYRRWILIVAMIWTGAVVGVPVPAAGAEADSDAEAQAQMIAKQVQYLDHLDRADELIARGDADGAIDLLNGAKALAVPDSTIPMMRMSSHSAAAHYALAVAYTMKEDWDAARRSLRDAGKNGYRNTAFVKSDPRLAKLRAQAGFDRLLELFPSENPTDDFAGKTVADQQFGMQMQMHRKSNFPKLGEWAPALELPLLEGGGKTLSLDSFRGDKPVVLVFGSFT